MNKRVPFWLVTLVLFILIAAGALLILAFWFGSFSSNFNQGQCYTEAIHVLSQSARKAALAGDTTSLRVWAESLDRLPLRGYESNCKEILDSIRELP
jgi:hypothetical protein